MKKLLSSIVMLFILVVITWFLAGWYLGAEAEKAFKGIIQENTQLKGEKLLRFDLLDYQKTFTGADAKLRISSDMPFLSERVGEFEVEVKLQNGPIFFTKTGISIGSSRWLLQIDETSLSTEDQENLKSIFPAFPPIMIVRLDFENTAYYLLKAESSIAQVFITGNFDLKSQNNRGAITLDDFNFDFFTSQLMAKKIAISYQHQKALTAAYKPGTTSIHIPSLQVKLASLKAPIDIKVDAKSNISINNNYLNGFLKAELSFTPINQISINNAKVNLLFKEMSADGFIDFSEAHADLDNLKQQAKWLLDENGEFPEGQDQIWQLYDQMESLSKQLPEVLQNKVLNQDSLIQFKAESRNPMGKSELSGVLKRVKSGGGVLRHTSTSLSTSGSAEPSINKSLTAFSAFLSVLQGQANVKLDDDLYAMISKSTAINKQRFKLIWKDNKLLMQ